jgi:hypothetical protein
MKTLFLFLKQNVDQDLSQALIMSGILFAFFILLYIAIWWLAIKYATSDREEQAPEQNETSIPD